MEGFSVVPVSYEMIEKSSYPMSFVGRRSFAPRPLSEATLIFDDSDEEEEEQFSSPQSLTPDNASQISVSTHEIPQTPGLSTLDGFKFHIEESPVKGPNGPHLFHFASEGKITKEDDIFLTMSPIGVAPAPTQQSKPISALNRAVAELDETQVRDWSPRQVAEWMAEAGFEPSVVEKFLIHDIYGSVLLDLQFEDLKEIDISSFGKRRQVMDSIQRLRNSSMIVPDKNSCATPVATYGVQPRTLARPARPDESHAFVGRSTSRRGRHAAATLDDVTPAESVSIVAIEQLLPDAHECAKGEDCPKWQKNQRKIQRIRARFAEESAIASPGDDCKSVAAPSVVASSVAAPSIVASSDVLGPGYVPVPITADALKELQPRDPQDNVRQFLDFQHVKSARSTPGPSPPPAPSAAYAAKPLALNNHLKGLPRLTIPLQKREADSPTRTPMSAFRNPTQQQTDLKAALLNDPYHYGGVASPVDVYRLDTPSSMTDIPVTALPFDPCVERETSASVPPEMKYGTPIGAPIAAENIRRCTSTAPEHQRRRQQSFMPTVAPVVEDEDASTARPITSEMNLANHGGWMRKRQNTRLFKHEWQDNYFNLQGGKLDMYENETMKGPSLETINVDQYALHAYCVASSSKLHAAFKKGVSNTTDEPKFGFSLIPENSKDKSKGHHFAVNNGRDRVEWMRKLMLAKAMRKGDTTCRF